MLQWCIRVHEFAEFTEFLYHLGKTPSLQETSGTVLLFNVKTDTVSVKPFWELEWFSLVLSTVLYLSYRCSLVIFRTVMMGRQILCAMIDLKCNVIGGWWRVTLVVAFAFLPQNFGKVTGDLLMIFCLSASAVWVVRILIGGGEHLKLNCYNCIHLNFLHSRGGGDGKTLLSCPHTLSCPCIFMPKPPSEPFNTYYFTILFFQHWEYFLLFYKISI